MSVLTTDSPVAGPQQRESLRELADRLSNSLRGYRVEIIEERLVLSPTPSFKHGGIVRRVSQQLSDQLPEDRVAHQVLSVEEAEGSSEDYTIPDLLVVPRAIEDEDEWLLSSEVVDLVLEVVSKDNSRIDTEVKPRVYAGWRIPIYLLADPRDGALVRYSDPRDGAYQGIHRFRFGDTVVLPEPLEGIKIDTAGFPTYTR